MNKVKGLLAAIRTMNRDTIVIFKRRGTQISAKGFLACVVVYGVVIALFG